MTGRTDRGQAKGQHAVPQHLLRRFGDVDGRLTVIRVQPEVKILRRQSAREVGTYRRLNSWQNPDGSWDDALEAGPMARLDGAGAEALEDVRRFAIEHRADEHLRLLDLTPEERVALYLTVAGLMVRSPELRDRLDEQALPTLKRHVLAGLEEAVPSGTARDDDVEPVRLAARRKGGFTLEPGKNRHQAILVPLLETVTAAIGSQFIVAVRRIPNALLVTGSEPVVLLETARIERGRSCAKLLTERDDPVRLWDERPRVLGHVQRILGDLAGLAVAIDPHTLVLMFNPDLDEGAKLAWIVSQLEPDALAGVANVMVTAGSRWIAGHDEMDFLELLGGAIDRRAS